MSKKILLLTWLAVLTTACSQKQSAVVEPPVTKIDVEKLNQPLDYQMDITGLSLADLRVLRHAPAARQGYPFKDAYLRGVYATTSWYDSLMWKYDETVDFSTVKERDNESWRDFYYRASEEVSAVKYTAEELDFMKRLKEREDELRKQNFEVDEGLKVNVANLTNPRQLTDFAPQLARQLAQDGFAIVPADNEQLFHVYEQNDYSQFPSFVTTDLYLQLYHLYFDCMLREMEEQRLDSLVRDFVFDMYINMHSQSMTGQTPTLRRLSHHVAVYFSIAYELLTGKGKPNGITDEQEEASEEVQKVMRAENTTSNFIGEYQEVDFPYSLFRPRGHYTRSERLQRYFRAMMWLQSVPFGLDSPEQVQIAAVIADEMNRHPTVMNTYQRINQLLTYLMGQPDNLSIVQVADCLKQTGKPLTALLDDAGAMGQLKKKLDEMGDSQTRIRPKDLRTSRNKVCLLPQRYQPDGEVLLEMVDYDSEPTKRATPQGLDVMAAMGVGAAEQLLMEESRQWKDYGSQLKKMKQRMGEVDWQQTIANQWLQTLKTVNSQTDDMPYFMVTPEWSRKNLNAALASWAELKHDAILYAKQPMGAECGGAGPPDPVVKGYVEPNVAFWQKAIELLDNTAKLLTSQGMMTEKIKEATERMAEEARFLLRVSEKELKGQMPTDEEMDQLKCVGATFENISLNLIREPDQYLMGWDDVQGTDRKVALVADVYTANADNNPEKSILYEAVGAADEIYVVVEIGGYLYLTRGAVLSYREFTRPIGEQRLTDEEWQQLLQKNPRKGVPRWMDRIICPLKQKPAVNEEIFYSSGC